jgi:hypothetical protein
VGRWEVGKVGRGEGEGFLFPKKYILVAEVQSSRVKVSKVPLEKKSSDAQL